MAIVLLKCRIIVERIFSTIGRFSTMKISELFHVSSDELDFYDIDLCKDTRLFIEPGRVLVSKDEQSQRAWQDIEDFFACLVAAYGEDGSNLEQLMIAEHLHEVNATKLGYGNGRNGKAKTPEGMMQAFSQLNDFLKQGVPISQPFDFPLFFPKFDIDCLSDVITNILLDRLSKYTREQCERLHVGPQYFAVPKKKPYYWDAGTHRWEVCCREQLTIDEEMILLVPKRWLRSSLYCNTDHFLHQMILHTLQNERTNIVNGKIMRPTIKELAQKVHQKYGAPSDTVIKFVRENPSLLRRYHDSIYRYYRKQYPKQ